MNRLKAIKIITFLMIFIAGVFSISAEGTINQHQVILHRQDDLNHKLEEDAEGRRMPQRPLQCVITQEGIYIAGIDSAEIYMYEVCDETGECMASFVTEQEFIGYVFQVCGTVEIRLYIDGYILHGFLHP